ncbi:MAG: hypothetical protein FWG19_01425, partial [Methanomassiliicoccaceae archaeon]|nr:hypothetical protein [Methanomassiliicoccaceae archaeon]
MKHLYSISAYHFDTDEYGGISEALDKIKGTGADGLELLTGYFTPDERFNELTVGVHLPYATDWYSVWTGDTRHIDPLGDDDVRYRAYGRNKEQIVNTVKEGIVNASS